MAFSDSERAKIYLYLGYSQRFLQINSVLDQAISSIGGNPEAVLIVQDLLNELDTVKAEIRTARRRLKYERIEDVYYRKGMEEIAALRSDGRMWAGQLASVFGVDVQHDAFSASGSSGQPTWVSQLMAGGSPRGSMKMG